MTKLQKNKKIIVLGLMVFIALFALGSSLAKEGYLGYILIRSETLNEVLFFINNITSLSEIYLVNLVKSMSDVNINVIKFLQALELNHVIAPVLLLLIFDFNRVYYRNIQIKVGIIIYTLSILFKYLIVLIITFIVTPSVMNPTILFEAVGFTLLLQQLFIFVSMILLFYGTYKIIRKEGSSC